MLSGAPRAGEVMKLRRQTNKNVWGTIRKDRFARLKNAWGAVKM